MHTRRPLVFACAVLAFQLGCDGPGPSGSEPMGPPIRATRAPTTSDMSVSSAAPDSATQDTTLDVVINGSGFVSGSTATWALAGVADPTQIRTNNTRYVNSRQLIASITVSASATIAKWDIVVTASGKKGGIGTELFTVKVNGNPKGSSVPLAVEVSDTGPLGPYQVKSDGLGEYVSGVQGMMAEIDGYGNLQISPNNANSTTPPLRTLRLDFNAPIDPNNSYRPDTSGQWNFKIKTNVYGNPKIQDLGVNGNPPSACYDATIAFNNLTTHHRANFNPASDPMSTRAYVTRTSVVPAAWSMVSDGTCPNANAGGVWSQDLVRKNAPLVFRGYYNLKFSMLLRAK